MNRCDRPSGRASGHGGPIGEGSDRGSDPGGPTGEGSDRGPPVVRVLAAVIERGGAFLVGLRPEHKRHGGLWEFPGGKFRPGESDTEAAARELREELALEVVGVGERIHALRDPGSPFVIEFFPVEVRGEPRALEHRALRWARPDELLALPLAPSDARFVREVLRATPGADLP